MQLINFNVFIDFLRLNLESNFYTPIIIIIIVIMLSYMRTSTPWQHPAFK